MSNSKIKNDKNKFELSELIEFIKIMPEPYKMKSIPIKIGTKIKFVEEKQFYTVNAANERYAICTKPFNLKHTVLYTIVDFQENIRGTENLIFCMGAETKKACEEMLQRLINDETEISRRNRIELKIEQIIGMY